MKIKIKFRNSPIPLFTIFRRREDTDVLWYYTKIIGDKIVYKILGEPSDYPYEVDLEEELKLIKEGEFISINKTVERGETNENKS